MSGEKIILKTSDGLSLVGRFQAEAGESAVLFLPQRGRDKDSFGDLPATLAKRGFSTLALDLRGHGESDGNLADFAPRDFSAMQNDVLAALNFLQSKGKTKISIVGASIGANLGLMALANSDLKLKRVVALSPGFDYSSLNAEAAVEKLATSSFPPASILFVAGTGDAYSFQTITKFQTLLGTKSSTVAIPAAAHGVDLLSAKPDLGEQIAEFLSA